MKNEAALVSEHNVTERRLYLAIELSHKKWKLGLSDGRCLRARIRSIEARDIQGLSQEIEQAKRHFGFEARVATVSC